MSPKCTHPRHRNPGLITPCPECAGDALPPTTELERAVLLKVGVAKDPYSLYPGSSRVVSQALGRLLRKGLIEERSLSRRRITDLGRAVLKEAGVL